MKIAMAADHGGYELKNEIKKHLQAEGYEIIDLGVNGPDSVDYPVYGEICGQYVACGNADLGVVCCGSGIGISMAANKIKGIRCALVTSDYAAEMCKRHNNANIISFGGRTTTVEDACRYTDIWLSTEFEGGRHEKRVNLLNSL